MGSARAGAKPGTTSSVVIANRNAMAAREVISSFLFLRSWAGPKRILLQVLVEGDDIVRSDPAGRADRKAHLGARREFARRLVVATRERRLRGREVGIGDVTLTAIGHGELLIGVARFGLLGQRRTQERDRLVRHLDVVIG